MPRVNDATAKAYRVAWEAWIKQIEHVHRVFLEDAPITPDKMKGLLNREARAWEAYAAARQQLLGVRELPAESVSDANPFR